MSENRAASREAWIGALVSSVTAAPGYKSALGDVLKRLCRVGSWSYAEAWIPTHDLRGLKMGPAVLRVRTDALARFRQRGRELGFLPGQGIAGQAFATGQPRWVEQLGAENDLPRRQALAREAGLEAAAAFPVPLRGRALATLLFFATEPRPLDDTLMEKVKGALAAVGPALDQKRVEMSVRAQARQHEVVAGIGLRALDKSADISSLLGEAASIAAKTLVSDGAAVLELDPDGGRLAMRATAGWPEGPRDATAAEPYFAFVLAAGRPVAVGNFRTEARFPAPALLGAAGAALSAVIEGRTRPLGLLCVRSKEPRRFADDAMGFVKALANVLGVALERDRAERMLERERARLEELVLERTAELEVSHEKLRQAERLRAIAALASGITHDMNNVMLPALCQLDAIEAAGLPVTTAREVEGVRGAFDKLRRLTRGLQLFATDPADGASFPASTRLHAWWKEVGELLAMAVRRGVEVIGSFDATLPPVGAPPPQLTQAVLSLVHDAGEALAGPGRIRLEGGAFATKFVRISVIAEGEPRSERRSADPGFPVARAFAVAVGGSLAIRSDDGGRTVTIVLPVAPSVAGTPSRPPSDALPRRAEIQLKDPRAAAFVTSLLASSGFEVAPRRDASVLAVWEGTEDPATVRRYLSEHSTRRVLLIGAPRTAAPAARVSVVNEPSNLEAVRRALGTMVEELLEITDDHI